MLFSPCLVLGLAALPMCAPNPLISCGQEFLSKGNVGKVEGGKVTSEKSSYIFSFHISCSKEFLYKGNIWGFSSHFLCTGIPYHRKYGRRWCYYFFQNSPFLPPLFSHFLWTGIPDRRKCEDQETTVRHLNNCHCLITLKSSKNAPISKLFSFLIYDSSLRSYVLCILCSV